MLQTILKYAGYVLGVIIAGFIVMVLLMYMSGCDTQAQYEPKQGALVFEYPNDYDQGVAYFVIYAGNSANQTIQLDSIGVMSYTFPDSVFEYRPFPINNAYVQGGAVAVDTVGGRSAMGITKVYGYWEIYGPEAPVNLMIRK
jgi:hypothetical protein